MAEILKGTGKDWEVVIGLEVHAQREVDEPAVLASPKVLATKVAVCLRHWPA